MHDLPIRDGQVPAPTGEARFRDRRSRARPPRYTKARGADLPIHALAEGLERGLLPLQRRR